MSREFALDFWKALERRADHYGLTWPTFLGFIAAPNPIKLESIEGA